MFDVSSEKNTGCLQSRSVCRSRHMAFNFSWTSAVLFMNKFILYFCKTNAFWSAKQWLSWVFKFRLCSLYFGFTQNKMTGSLIQELRRSHWHLFYLTRDRCSYITGWNSTVAVKTCSYIFHFHFLVPVLFSYFILHIHYVSGKLCIHIWYILAQFI